MCGIAGCLTKDLINNNLINKILNSMYNRGPDNQDKVRFEVEKTYIYFIAD